MKRNCLDLSDIKPIVDDVLLLSVFCQNKKQQQALEITLEVRNITQAILLALAKETVISVPKEIVSSDTKANLDDILF